MDYTEACAYLASLHHIARKEYLADPTDCIVYLKRMQFLLNLLGNPERKIPHYIHVTGTSGKGSVSLMLGSILRVAGKNTGTLTSPSPDGFLGRAEINGRALGKHDFARLATVIKTALEKYATVSPYDTPSPFEVLTALALLYFAEKKVAWAVVEVGLGGRYDSTNIIPWKDVAVVTNIGLDHVALIGPTKAKIAYEKAGIIKPGCQVFTAERDPKVLRVIKKECKKTNTKISNIQYLISDIRNSILDIGLNGTNFIFNGTKYYLPTLGRHQITNAILTIEIARSLKISDAAIRRGLARVQLPIRIEVVSKKPLIILDGAHNVDKMKTTVETMKEMRNETSLPVLSSAEARKNRRPLSLAEERGGRGLTNVHLIVAFSADKNISAMIKQLASLKPTSIACTHFTCNPFRRAADPAQLAKRFKKLLPRAKIAIFLDPKDALSWSLKKMSSRGRNPAPSRRSGAGARGRNALLVTGSIFLSGELRQKFFKV